MRETQNINEGKVDKTNEKNGHAPDGGAVPHAEEQRERPTNGPTGDRDRRPHLSVWVGACESVCVGRVCN